jgi:hypothetical protein
MAAVAAAAVAVAVAAAAAAGTYNDKLQYVRTTPCTPCPNGTTNTMPGSDSVDDCDSESHLTVATNPSIILLVVPSLFT